MKRPLKVGDICVGVGFLHDTEFNRLECTIIGALRIRSGVSLSTGKRLKEMSFEVRWETGELTPVRPHNLKLKPPKQDALDWAASKVKDLFKENDLVHA